MFKTNVKKVLLNRLQPTPIKLFATNSLTLVGRLGRFRAMAYIVCINKTDWLTKKVTKLSQKKFGSFFGLKSDKFDNVDFSIVHKRILGPK